MRQYDAARIDDDDAARRYAEIRDDLEIRGEIIGPNDLLIAAIALTHNLVLVTNNARTAIAMAAPMVSTTPLLLPAIELMIRPAMPSTKTTAQARVIQRAAIALHVPSIEDAAHKTRLL